MFAKYFCNMEYGRESVFKFMFKFVVRLKFMLKMWHKRIKKVQTELIKSIIKIKPPVYIFKLSILA